MIDDAKIQLMQHLAWQLVGPDVTVRIRVPATVGLAGEAHTGNDGKRYVDIKPNQKGRTLAEVFLHELGHHKKQRFIPSNVYLAEPETLEQVHPDRSYIIHEIEAESAGAAWLHYGLLKANATLLAADPALAILIPLINYNQEKAA